MMKLVTLLMVAVVLAAVSLSEGEAGNVVSTAAKAAATNVKPKVIPNKVGPTALKVEPTALKVEPTAVKVETTTVKVEPTAVKADPQPAALADDTSGDTVDVAEEDVVPSAAVAQNDKNKVKEKIKVVPEKKAIKEAAHQVKIETVVVKQVKAVPAPAKAQPVEAKATKTIKVDKKAEQILDIQNSTQTVIVKKG